MKAFNLLIYIYIYIRRLNAYNGSIDDDTMEAFNLLIIYIYIYIYNYIYIRRLIAYN